MIIFIPVTVKESVTIDEQYPFAVYKVLERLGWKHTPTKTNLLSVWHKSVFEVDVPLRTDFGDFAECFDCMVSNIAKAEGMDKGAVLKMIREAPRW